MRSLEYASRLNFDTLRNDITYRALFMFLSGLSKKAMKELKALVWVGRGSDPDFIEALSLAKKTGLNDVAYILEKAFELPDYFIRGKQLVATDRA